VVQIHQRLIKTHAEILETRRFDVFPNNASAWALSRRTIVGPFGIEETEAFVMFVVITM
jgi:hypothetical protein